MIPDLQFTHVSTKSVGVIAGLILALLIPFQPAYAADLIINVVNLAIKSGFMKAAVFDNPKEFPRGKKKTGQKVKVHSKKAQFIFKGLEMGKQYAIAVYHDENENGEFDKAFLGFPLEGFGFSRDASVLTGTPAFTDSKFKITRDKMEITIKLKHSVFD